MGAKEDISLLELLLKDIHIYVQWRFTMKFKKRLLARPEEAMRNSVAITMYWTYWSNLHPTGICLRSNYFYSEETKSPTALVANKLFCSWVLALWVLNIYWALIDLLPFAVHQSSGQLMQCMKIIQLLQLGQHACRSVPTTHVCTCHVEKSL